MSNIPVFKTIEIGTFKSVADLRKAFKETGVGFGPVAYNILDKTKLSKSKQALDLAVLSVRELGFTDGAFLRGIYKAAKKKGLSLCPAEVGPQLRLQYTDQRYGERLLIAMKPIKDSVGDLCLFSVTHDGDDRWLSVYSGLIFWGWYRFVFVHRK